MIVAEIGLNHIGNETYAKHYVEELIKTNVTAITFQVREPAFYERPEKAHLKIDLQFYKNISKKIKTAGKKFGIALSDISVFEELDPYVDFYKILSKDFNSNLSNKIIKSTKKMVYLSTGNSSVEEIKKYIKSFPTQRKENLSLIHTQLSYDIKDVNLKAILSLRDKTNCNISFGNHCEDKNVCFISLAYNPHSIFLYIKGNENIKYPDDKHSVCLSEIDKFCNQLNKLKLSIGTGTKVSMKNKIRDQK
jgi:sialic acid synthase SpsE